MLPRPPNRISDPGSSQNLNDFHETIIVGVNDLALNLGLTNLTQGLADIALNSVFNGPLADVMIERNPLTQNLFFQPVIACLSMGSRHILITKRVSGTENEVQQTIFEKGTALAGEIINKILSQDQDSDTYKESENEPSVRDFCVVGIIAISGISFYYRHITKKP